MTRAKVLSIAFLAGLIVGCAVPAARAVSVDLNKTFIEAGVNFVNKQTCVVLVDDDQYSVPCEAVDLFSQGDSVSVGSIDGQTVIVTVDGEEVETR